jgi:hypothetical protein
MQVSTRLRTLLPVLPDVQREALRETQSRLRRQAEVKVEVEVEGEEEVKAEVKANVEVEKTGGARARKGEAHSFRDYGHGWSLTG